MQSEFYLQIWQNCTLFDTHIYTRRSAANEAELQQPMEIQLKEGYHLVLKTHSQIVCPSIAVRVFYTSFQVLACASMYALFKGVRIWEFFHEAYVALTKHGD